MGKVGGQRHLGEMMITKRVMVVIEDLLTGGRGSLGMPTWCERIQDSPKSLLELVITGNRSKLRTRTSEEKTNTRKHGGSWQKQEGGGGWKTCSIFPFSALLDYIRHTLLHQHSLVQETLVGFLVLFTWYNS